MSARETLLQAVGPSLAYIQARAAGQDLRSVDFDVARRLFIERVSGERENGTLSVLSATLEEGMAPSLPRIRQWRQSLRDLVERLQETPEQFGVRVIDYEEV
jgi:hypothetical protein